MKCNSRSRSSFKTKPSCSRSESWDSESGCPEWMRPFRSSGRRFPLWAGSRWSWCRGRWTRRAWNTGWQTLRRSPEWSCPWTRSCERRAFANRTWARWWRRRCPTGPCCRSRRRWTQSGLLDLENFRWVFRRDQSDKWVEIARSGPRRPCNTVSNLVHQDLRLRSRRVCK